MTLISALISAVGLGFIVCGADYVVGAVLLIVGLLLDGADGHIARFQSSASRFGALADAMVAFFTYSLLPLCIAWSLYHGPPEPWLESLSAEISREAWVAIGVCRSTCALLTLGVGLQSKLLTQAGYRESFPRHGVLFAARAIAEGEFLLLLIAALFSAVGLLHLAYGAFQLLALVGVVWLSLGYARRVDQQGPQS